MNVVRFIFLLFAFTGLLAACAAAVLIAIVMLRFLPVLIIVILACMLLSWLLKKAGVHIKAD